MQAIAMDLESKLTLREKEIELNSEKSNEDKLQAKRDLYLQILEIIASKDKGFSTLITKVKAGLCNTIHIANEQSDTIVHRDKSLPISKQSEDSDLKQRLAGYERVMKEMKKQIAG